MSIFVESVIIFRFFENIVDHRRQNWTFCHHVNYQLTINCKTICNSNGNAYVHDNSIVESKSVE